MSSSRLPGWRSVQFSKTADGEKAYTVISDGSLVGRVGSTEGGGRGSPHSVETARGSKNDEVFTVEEAVEHIGFGRYQLKMSVYCGVVYMADAMEVMILSILGPEARCEFGLKSWQEAFIPTVVFFGMLTAVWWGWFMDKYGRRRTIFVQSLWTAYFSFLSAFSISYAWLLILRGLVGVFLGGAVQATTYYAEFLPASKRAFCVIFLEVWWAVGTLFEVLLAYFIVPTLGWHYLLGFSCVPLFLTLLFFPFLQPSPRYHMVIGDVKKARMILEAVACENKTNLPDGRLVSNEEKKRILSLRECPSTPGDSDVDDHVHVDNQTLLYQEKGNPLKPAKVKDLFREGKTRRTTLLLMVVWFCSAFAYFGVVLFTTEIQQVYSSIRDGSAGVNSTCADHIGEARKLKDGECLHLKADDYKRTVVATAAEFPGIILAWLLCIAIGRTRSLALVFSAGAAFFSLTLLCEVSVNTLVVFIFGTRCFISAGYDIMFIYVPEVYPTTIRSLGLGVGSMMARFGAILTPFVAQSFLRESVRGTKIIYICMSALAAIASMFLPIETKNRPMEDDVNEIQIRSAPSSCEFLIRGHKLMLQVTARMTEKANGRWKGQNYHTMASSQEQALDGGTLDLSARDDEFSSSTV